jgi:hypothetical protein
MRVDIDLAQWAFSNVRKAVRRTCGDRDDISGTHVVFFVANSAPCAAFLHNDDLVIVVPVEWNSGSKRCGHKKDRVQNAILLADEFVRHSSEWQFLALNDIHDRGWYHKRSDNSANSLVFKGNFGVARSTSRPNRFIANEPCVVGYSFVQRAEDISGLLGELDSRRARFKRKEKLAEIRAIRARPHGEKFRPGMPGARFGNGDCGA